MSVKALIGFLGISFLSLLQTTPLFDFNFIKPNLVLSGFLALIALGWAVRELIPAWAGLIVSVSQFFNYWLAEAALISAFVIGAVLFAKFFSIRPFLNLFLLVALATFGFYLFASNGQFDWVGLAQELPLNAGFGLLFYLGLRPVLSYFDEKS